MTDSNLFLYQHYCHQCATVSQFSFNGTKVTTTLFDNIENKLIVERGYEGLYVNYPLVWNSSQALFISSEKNIIFGPNGSITNHGNGTIYLHSGVESNYNGTVIFTEASEDVIRSLGGGEIVLTYNPKAEEGLHKYHRPQSFSKYIQGKVIPYMLVHDAQDFQDINEFPSGNYALCKDIDLASNNQNFQPIGTSELPFTGHLNGNGHSISNLRLETPGENFASLFGVVIGQHMHHAVIEDLMLSNITVAGDHYVGTLFGRASAVAIENIKISDCKVSGTSVIGGVGGTGTHLLAQNFEIDAVETECRSPEENDQQYTGSVFGAVGKSQIFLLGCNDNQENSCIGYSQETEYL